MDGAHLRIDTWPEAVDGTGMLLGPPGGPRPADFPPTLSRKDAAAFAKAARQRGVISKLDLICAGGWGCCGWEPLRTGEGGRPCACMERGTRRAMPGVLGSRGRSWEEEEPGRQRERVLQAGKFSSLLLV